MSLKSRIGRLEADRFGPGPARLRLVVTTPVTLDLEKSTCIRTRAPNGALTEIIYLEGMREHLSDEDFEAWVQSFPIEECAR